MIARFFNVFLASVLSLGLLFLALPALLQITDAPSFRLGEGLFLLAEWRNDATGTQIRFGLVPLGTLALAIALIDQWMGGLNGPWPRD